MRRYVLISKHPIYKHVRNALPAQAPAWTALTISSGAAGAVGPAPRGAETGRWV